MNHILIGIAIVMVVGLYMVVRICMMGIQFEDLKKIDRLLDEWRQ